MSSSRANGLNSFRARSYHQLLVNYVRWHALMYIKCIYAFRMNVRLNGTRQLVLPMNMQCHFREAGCYFFKIWFRSTSGFKLFVHGVSAVWPVYCDIKRGLACWLKPVFMGSVIISERIEIICLSSRINPYPTAFPYGNGMVLHFYQQQESSTNKTVHKVINKGLKTYV